MKEVRAKIGDCIYGKFEEMWKIYWEEEEKPVTMVFNGVRVLIFKDKEAR